MTIGKSKGRILFVNGDPDNDEFVTLMLNEVGYETVIARNINVGLKLIREESFEMFLIDWQYEDGTGIELCQSIRLVNEQTPILFYTAETHPDDLVKALHAGAQGCFIKPIDIQ